MAFQGPPALVNKLAAWIQQALANPDARRKYPLVIGPACSGKRTLIHTAIQACYPAPQQVVVHSWRELRTQSTHRTEVFTRQCCPLKRPGPRCQSCSTARHQRRVFVWVLPELFPRASVTRWLRARRRLVLICLAPKWVPLGRLTWTLTVPPPTVSIKQKLLRQWARERGWPWRPDDLTGYWDCRTVTQLRHQLTSLHQTSPLPRPSKPTPMQLIKQTWGRGKSFETYCRARQLWRQVQTKTPAAQQPPRSLPGPNGQALVHILRRLRTHPGELPLFADHPELGDALWAHNTVPDPDFWSTWDVMLGFEARAPGWTGQLSRPTLGFAPVSLPRSGRLGSSRLFLRQRRWTHTQRATRETQGVFDIRPTHSAQQRLRKRKTQAQEPQRLKTPRHSRHRCVTWSQK